MNSQLITITEYCIHHNTEPTFIEALEKNGLLTLTVVEQERFINYNQLSDLEAYTRWYYELDVNIEGIDAMRHLLTQIKNLQTEMQQLRERVRLYERD